MSFLFPKPPAAITNPKAPPPPPTREDPLVTKAVEDTRLATAKRKGRKSQILTSPLGATDVPNVTRKALLGQVGG